MAAILLSISWLNVKKGKFQFSVKMNLKNNWKNVKLRKVDAKDSPIK